MTETTSPGSPLARLVLFMVCMAVAGSCAAGMHYVVLARPAQEAALHPPANSGSCTLITTGRCAGIRSSICMIAGSDMTYIRSCMELHGCCV